MIILQKYNQDVFILPAVVDVINFEAHITIDVIQQKDELFKKDALLSYNGEEFMVHKKLDDKPIKTGVKIKDRLNIRKVRYFCNKIKTNGKEQDATPE